MAIREKLCLTISTKCKSSRGTWQPEWNAKMLANSLQALGGEVGVGGWGGGAGHVLVLLVLETGGVATLSVTFQVVGVEAVEETVDLPVNTRGPSLSLRTGWLGNELPAKTQHSVTQKPKGARYSKAWLPSPHVMMEPN